MAMRLEVVEPPVVPGRLRRGYARLATTRLVRVVSRVVGWRLDPVVLRISGGRLSTTLGIRSGTLETRGARTGELRRHAVIYFHDGDLVTIVASNAGAPRHPAWFHNLRADPRVTFAGLPMRATVVVDEDERRRLEGLADRTFPGFARYRSEAAAVGRKIPIVQLTRTD